MAGSYSAAAFWMKGGRAMDNGYTKQVRERILMAEDAQCGQVCPFGMTGVSGLRRIIEKEDYELCFKARNLIKSFDKSWEIVVYFRK